MSEFAIQILKNTPIWVWAILAALIYLGGRQLKPRVVKRFSVLIAPVAFLFVGLMAAGRGSVGFATWAVSLLTLAAVSPTNKNATGAINTEKRLTTRGFSCLLPR